jgi:hypothetical protein
VAYKPRETPSLPLCFAQFRGVPPKYGVLPGRIGAEARLNVDRKKVDIVSVQDRFVSRKVRLIVSILREIFASSINPFVFSIMKMVRRSL